MITLLISLCLTSLACRYIQHIYTCDYLMDRWWISYKQKTWYTLFGVNKALIHTQSKVNFKVTLIRDTIFFTTYFIICWDVELWVMQYHFYKTLSLKSFIMCTMSSYNYAKKSSFFIIIFISQFYNMSSLIIKWSLLKHNYMDQNVLQFNQSWNALCGKAKAR